MGSEMCIRDRPSPALVRVDRFDVPGLEHVAEIVLDRPEAMNLSLIHI